jgi:hypothetical protein
MEAERPASSREVSQPMFLEQFPQTVLRLYEALEGSQSALIHVNQRRMLPSALHVCV